MAKRKMSPETAVVHAGNPEERVGGAVVPPIFQSSTFEYTGQERYEDLRYIRLNNTPNHRALQRKIAVLEEGEAALVVSSGMAAITATLLTFLKQGDHFLAQNCLYGGTRDLISQELSALGISASLIDASKPDSWADKVRSTTRAIYVETISNPLIRIGELVEVVRFARRHGIVAIIDNTFACPINFQPLTHGFDLVIHSCTKYLNGHTDLVAGAVIGSRELISEINRRAFLLGGCLDPHTCFLLDRGIKTLALRVRYQNQSAESLARFLASHPKVKSVFYPALEIDNPTAETRALFSGFGGMLSFELDVRRQDTVDFVRALRIPVEAPSLGGVESLITRPATTSHSGWSPEEREATGISETLIRYSVGIEGTEDLLEDLEQALNRI